MEKKQIFTPVFVLLSLSIALIGCGNSEPVVQAQEPKLPITAKIIFESNREALSDQMDINGTKYGLSSLYTLENGKIKKMHKGGGHPRWSPDGKKIACIMSHQGKIAILDEKGKLDREIQPKYYALSLEWYSDSEVIYIGSEKIEGNKLKQRLIKYNLQSNSEEILYEVSPNGRIGDLSWISFSKILLFEISDRIKGMQSTNRIDGVASLDLTTKQVTVFLENSFTPIMLNDGVSLILTTNRYPNGEKISKYGWGALVKYNIQTKEFQVIRKSGWIRSMRLSSSGKQVLISEDAEKEGVAVSIYSVDNLVDPIYRIPMAEVQPNENSQDVNADILE